MDIDSLLTRLRTAAAQHPGSDETGVVEVRPWPGRGQAGPRQALLEGLARGATPGIGRYLVIDDVDFVDLAFFVACGRAPDPAGRSHYLGVLQQGTPRLEVLGQLAGSDEALAYRGPPARPLWLRVLLLGLRLPSSFGRRATRAVMRRLERRLGRRGSGAAERMVWMLASGAEALARDLTAAEERARFLEVELARLEARLRATEGSVASRFEETSSALVALRARLATAEYASQRSSGAEGGTPAAPARLGPIDEVTRYYLTLESVFRGAPERIRDQMEKDYLQLLLDARARAGDGPCVDLGCGRGEWLDVLEAHGFSATGVDANPFMAAAARERGQPVVDGDALAYLGSLPDDSLLAVTAFHLIEHLPFAVLFRLIAECRRVLKPEGILILETPNPENILVATHTFHHDPTHSQPLTPSSVEFLVNHHGLQTVSLLRLHPYPPEARLPGTDPASERLNGMTCCGQDFAVVARKAVTE